MFWDNVILITKVWMTRVLSASELHVPILNKQKKGLYWRTSFKELQPELFSFVTRIKNSNESQRAYKFLFPPARLPLWNIQETYQASTACNCEQFMFCSQTLFAEATTRFGDLGPELGYVVYNWKKANQPNQTSNTALYFSIPNSFYFFTHTSMRTCFVDEYPAFPESWSKCTTSATFLFMIG